MSRDSPRAEPRVPVHPFLVASVPVLSLWSSNADQVDPSVAGLAVAAALLLAGVLLALGRLVIGDWQRAGAWASLCLVLFFSHGLVVETLLSDELMARSSASRTALLCATLVAAAAAGVFFARTRLPLRPAASLVTAGAAALCAYACLQLLFSVVSGSADATGSSGELAAPGRAVGPAREPLLVDSEARPDIYYIVLDGYTSAGVLRRVFHFDNRPFLDALRTRGFYIAERSRANYAMTQLSLSSILNAAYLDDLARRLGPESVSFAEPYALIRQHWVGRFLRARGYRYVQLFTNWGGTERSEIADLGFSYQPWWLRSEFTGVLLRATLLRDFAPSVAGFHRYALKAIREVPALKGPTFLFAHLLLPHEPYVFDREGKVRADIPLHLRAHWAVKRQSEGESADRAYAEQVEYLNRELLALVDEIVASSASRPVIVLQGDHGWASQDAEPRTREFTQARFPILSAFLVPDAVRERLYPEISPVNTFRVLISGLFAIELPTLPDRQYLSWYDAPYQLKDVTEELSLGSTLQEQ